MRLLGVLFCLICQLGFTNLPYKKYNIFCDAELHVHDLIYMYHLNGEGNFVNYKFTFSNLPTIGLSVRSELNQQTTEVFSRQALKYKSEICNEPNYCSLVSFTERNMGSDLIYSYDDTSSSLNIRHYLEADDVIKFSLGFCAFK